MAAVCLTRPQYVLRSYCDSGSSRLPGMEDDMLALRPGHACFLFLSLLCLALTRAAEKESEQTASVAGSISCVK
jgi:hypothetical protein